MQYRVRYLDKMSDQIARFGWMDQPAALDLARQMVAEGERNVEVEDEAGGLSQFERRNEPRGK